MDKFMDSDVLSPLETDKQQAPVLASTDGMGEDPSPFRPMFDTPEPYETEEADDAADMKEKKRLRAGAPEPLHDPFAPSQKFHDMKTYRRKSIFRKYNFVPLIAVGLISFFASQLILGLLFSCIAYLARVNMENAILFPTLSYIIGLLAATGLMTLLIKGGTVFPSLILAILITALTAILAGKEALSFLGILSKLSLSLIFSIVGFTAAKLYILYRKNLPDKMADNLTFRDYN